MNVAEHLARVPGGSPVPTRMVAATREALRHILPAGEGAVLSGPPDAGKTFAAEVAIELDCRVPVVRWEVAMQSMPAHAFLTDLLSTLTGVPQDGTFSQLLAVGRECFDAHEGLLVIEHAENLTKHTADLLRHCRGRERRSSALLLITRDEADDTLERFGSAISRTVIFDALRDAELLGAVRRLQPRLRSCSDALLEFIDVNYAHGLLGRWAAFAADAERLCARDGVELDRSVATRVFALRSGVVTRSSPGGRRRAA